MNQPLCKALRLHSQSSSSYEWSVSRHSDHKPSFGGCSVSLHGLCLPQFEQSSRFDAGSATMEGMLSGGGIFNILDLHV